MSFNLVHLVYICGQYLYLYLFISHLVHYFFWRYVRTFLARNSPFVTKHWKRLGTIKFWIIMIVPLLYFLSQFQPLVTGVLLDYSYGNPMLYSIVYVLTLEVSTPIGGLLFGLAFMLVALRIQNAKVKGYLVISGIGLLLLLISYRPQEIITGPFPPFGILSVFVYGIVFILSIFRYIFVCNFCISGFQPA